MAVVLKTTIPKGIRSSNLLSSAKPLKETDMKKYEYTKVHYKNAVPTSEELSKMTKQGWQSVRRQSHEGGVLITFKRPIKTQL